MTTRTPFMSRRRLLKVGLCGAAVLATAGWTASLIMDTKEPAGAGYKVLRESDLPFLQRVIPVLLAGSVSTYQWAMASETTVRGLDDILAHFSPAMRQEVMQLFDIMSTALTRGPLTGIWSSWDETSDDVIQHFLQRWRDSRFDLLKKGHGALLQLVSLAWYGSEQAWGHCHYRPPVIG